MSSPPFPHRGIFTDVHTDEGTANLRRQRTTLLIYNPISDVLRESVFKKTELTTCVLKHLPRLLLKASLSCGRRLDESFQNAPFTVRYVNARPPGLVSKRSIFTTLFRLVFGPTVVKL